MHVSYPAHQAHLFDSLGIVSLPDLLPKGMLLQVIDSCRERRLTRDHGHTTLAPALLERFCAKDW